MAKLREFAANSSGSRFYDLLLVDIDMPRINGFELFGKIFAIDFNVRVCLISSGEINWEALRKYIQDGEKDVVLEAAQYIICLSG